jgi:hypothetical protein
MILRYLAGCLALAALCLPVGAGELDRETVKVRPSGFALKTTVDTPARPVAQASELDQESPTQAGYRHGHWGWHGHHHHGWYGGFSYYRPYYGGYYRPYYYGSYYRPYYYGGYYARPSFYIGFGVGSPYYYGW